jgi:hypothetical protein
VEDAAGATTEAADEADEVIIEPSLQSPLSPPVVAGRVEFPKADGAEAAAEADEVAIEPSLQSPLSPPVLVEFPEADGAAAPVPFVTPAATNRASASACEAHEMLMPGFVTSGRAKHAVCAAHGVSAQVPDTHWAKAEVIHASSLSIIDKIRVGTGLTKSYTDHCKCH